MNPGVLRLPRAGLRRVVGNHANPKGLVYAKGSHVPRVGAVLLGAPSSLLPYGLIARVKARHAHAGTENLSIVNVPVSDAYPEYAFSGGAVIHQAARGMSAALPGAAISQTECGPAFNIGTFNIGANLESVQVNQVSWSLFPPELSLVLTVKTKETTGLSGEWGGGPQCSWDLVPPPTWHFMCGDIPCYFAIPLQAYVNLGESLQPFLISYESSHVLTLGIGSDNHFNLAETGQRIVADSGVPHWTLAGALGVGLSAEFGLGDPESVDVHLDVGVKGEVDLPAQATEPCSINLIPGSLDAGAKLGPLTASFNFWNATPINFWSGCGTPTLKNPGSQTTTVGNPASLQIDASDEANQKLAYSATGLPAGLTIDPDSGLISGTPSTLGTSTVTVTVHDTGLFGGSTKTSFTWTVSPATVTVFNPGDQTSTVGIPVTLQIQASDSNASQSLTYSATGLPAGLAIDHTSGLISGTPTTVGTSTVVVTATDKNSGSGRTSFIWTIASPTVTVSNPGSQTSTAGTAVNLQIDATDSGGRPLTYAASGLPAGLAIDPSSGLISGTPTTVGTSTVSVTATDPGVTSENISFTWTVTLVKAVEAVLPNDAAANPGTSLDSISCASAGNCSAVGTYVDNSGNSQGLLLNEINGVWQPGSEATLPTDAFVSPNGVVLTSVSCASAGNCSAVGNYQTTAFSGPEGLVLNETNGDWEPGIEASLPADDTPAIAVSLEQVSCPSAGNCSAVGDTIGSPGNSSDVLLLLNETNGDWGPVTEATPPNNVLTPNAAGALHSVSCPSAGNCTAVGAYEDSATVVQGLLISETNGTWGTATEAPLPGNATPSPNDEYASVSSVSCPSANNCYAVGEYPRNFGRLGLLLSETNGNWSASEATESISGAFGEGLGAVSCPSVGNCSASGEYMDGVADRYPEMLNQTNGIWGSTTAAILPASAAAPPNQSSSATLSCASAGNCSAVGIYEDASHDTVNGLLLNETNGTWGTGIAPPLPANARSNRYSWVFTVSCPPGGTCSAVGIYRDNSGNTPALLLNRIDPSSPSATIRPSLVRLQTPN